MSGLLKELYSDSAIVSHEVMEILDSKAIDENFKLWWDCFSAYLHMQYKFDVEEDYESSDEWIIGVIHADTSAIREAIQNELESCEFDEVWNVLVSKDLVKVIGDTVRLPLLAGKLAVLEEAEGYLDYQLKPLAKIDRIDRRDPGPAKP